MKAIIEIDMDNAAFEDCANQELQRILEGVVEGLDEFGETFYQSKGILRDTNGNTVGTFRVEGDE